MHIIPHEVMNTDDILEKLHKKCRRYTKSPSYVYKLCRNYNKKKKETSERKWLVVLKKISTTVTNECRSNVVDANYAKFRASELKVIKIINTTKPNYIKKKITNVFEDIKTVYKVGEIVKPSTEYDMGLDNVCSSGIHYFKTLEPAYFYEKSSYIVNNGKVLSWYDNGQMFQSGSYVNREPEGLWTTWNRLGQVFKYGYYRNGKRDGEWVDTDNVYYSGETYKCHYKNGILVTIKKI